MVSKFSTLVSVLATIALSAVHYHDRVGLILVSDKVEKFIPARSGRNHVIHLIQSIITHTSQAGGSDLRPGFVHDAAKGPPGWTGVPLICSYSRLARSGTYPKCCKSGIGSAV